MLFTDFYFQLKSQNAICVAGWTMGGVEHAYLFMDDKGVAASACLCHQRSDLPPGATGFILRFNLEGAALESENASLRLEDPPRLADLSNSTADLKALINTAPDELFICLLMGIAEGLFAVEDAGIQVNLHKRVLAMAGSRNYVELAGAAASQDLSMYFTDPTRFLVSGWMVDSGMGAPVRRHGLVIDQTGFIPLEVHPGVLIRPDLAEAMVNGLRVGASSGFVATGKSGRSMGPSPVCMIALIHGLHTISTLCLLKPYGPAELCKQYEYLRRNLIDPDGADALLDPLLPSLPGTDQGPESSRARRILQPVELSGLAFVIAHDLDPWLTRDVVRLIRLSEPDADVLRLVIDEGSGRQIQAARADGVEASGKGPLLDPMNSRTPLVNWASSARHLVYANSAMLFQTMPFAELAAARIKHLPAWCLVLTDNMEPGRFPLSSEEGIEALINGAPFVAQIDQMLLAVPVVTESLPFSHEGQMRWLLTVLAKMGVVSFVADSGLGFMSGLATTSHNNRLMELKALRKATTEI